MIILILFRMLLFFIFYFNYFYCLQAQEYTVTTDGENVEAVFVRHGVGKMNLTSSSALTASHSASELHLLREIASTREDISDMDSVNLMNASNLWWQSAGTTAWLIVISLAVFGFVLLILYRHYVVSRKATPTPVV